MGLSDVVKDGDRRESLRAIRDRLAAELESAEGRDVAPIARELRAVIAELDGMPADKEASPVVDLRARIAGKQAAAGVQSPAVQPVVRARGRGARGQRGTGS